MRPLGIRLRIACGQSEKMIGMLRDSAVELGLCCEVVLQRGDTVLIKKEDAAPEHLSGAALFFI